MTGKRDAHITVARTGAVGCSALEANGEFPRVLRMRVQGVALEVTVASQHTRCIVSLPPPWWAAEAIDRFNASKRYLKSMPDQFSANPQCPPDARTPPGCAPGAGSKLKRANK